MPGLVLQKFLLHHEVRMPYGARVLGAGIEDDRIHIYAIADPGAPPVSRRFYMLLDGEGADQVAFMEYIGNFSVGKNATVYHLFEEKDANLQR